MVSKRLRQLKFIASIFNQSLKEIKETLGFETLTMIFRRVGESSAEQIVERLKGRYNTPEEFGNIMIKEVIEPVIGDGKGKITVNGGQVEIVLEACPYKKAGGFPIKEMEFFCHYTEGLFDNAFKLAFPELNMEITPKELISQSCTQCVFRTG